MKQQQQLSFVKIVFTFDCSIFKAERSGQRNKKRKDNKKMFSVGTIGKVGSSTTIMMARGHRVVSASASAFRAFSNTAAAMADQYDVVVVGTSSRKVWVLLDVCRDYMSLS